MIVERIRRNLELIGPGNSDAQAAQVAYQELEQLRHNTGEHCHSCNRSLSVCELLSDRCYGCGSKPSVDPNPEIPF